MRAAIESLGINRVIAGRRWRLGRAHAAWGGHQDAFTFHNIDALLGGADFNPNVAGILWTIGRWIVGGRILSAVTPGHITTAQAQHHEGQGCDGDGFEEGFLESFHGGSSYHETDDSPTISSLPICGTCDYRSSMKTSLILSALIFCAVLTGADKPNEIILFDGKSLDDWQIVEAGGSGQVEARDGQIMIGTGEGLTGAIYKKTDKIPVTNYEITLEAQRLEGDDFFCGLTFPVGNLKTCATLVCGGWGGSVTGISCIDGLDASENSTGHFRKWENKKWHQIKVRVTPESITVWAKDEKIIDVEIKGRKIGLRSGPIEDFAPLSLTTYQTTAAIRNVKLTPLPEKK